MKIVKIALLLIILSIGLSGTILFRLSTKASDRLEKTQSQDVASSFIYQHSILPTNMEQTYTPTSTDSSPLMADSNNSNVVAIVATPSATPIVTVAPTATAKTSIAPIQTTGSWQNATKKPIATSKSEDKVAAVTQKTAAPKSTSTKKDSSTDAPKKTASSSDSDSNSSDIQGMTSSQEKQAVIIYNGINDLRSKNDLKPLSKSGLLAKIAQYRAEHMAKHQYFSHTYDDELHFRVVADMFGYSTTKAIGENIGQCIGFEDYGKVMMESWTNSKGHYDNMVNTKWSIVGVGISKDKDGMIYMVQIFGQ